MAQQEPNFVTIRILWFSMLASMGIFGVLPFFLQLEPVADPIARIEEFAPMVMALTVVAATNAVLAMLARPFMFSRAVKNPQASDSLLAEYQTASILAWALAESVGIMGFVLTFLTQIPWLLYPYLGVAALLIIANAPRERHIEEAKAARPPENPDPEGASW